MAGDSTPTDHPYLPTCLLPYPPYLPYFTNFTRNTFGHSFPVMRNV